MPRPLSPAQQELRYQVLDILSCGFELRQFEIAKALNIIEHNNWSTHAVLNHMLKVNEIQAEYMHTINKDGTLSKRAHRYFRLSNPPKIRILRRGMWLCDVLAAWFAKYWQAVSKP